MTTRAKCLLCDVWEDDILNHLRLMHPDYYTEVEGDGPISVEDRTGDDE